jgi:hypothetical protein
MGGDAVGNTLVSLSVVTDPVTIQRRYPHPEEKDNLPLGDDIVLQVTGSHLENETDELDEDHASITVLPQAPVPHCALRARIWILYEQRHIDKGDEYYEESQQTVSLMRDADEPRDVDFMSPDDVSPAAWSIQVVEKHTSQQNRNDEDNPITEVWAPISKTIPLGARRASWCSRIMVKQASSLTGFVPTINPESGNCSLIIRTVTVWFP